MLVARRGIVLMSPRAQGRWRAGHSSELLQFGGQAIEYYFVY